MPIKSKYCNTVEETNCVTCLKKRLSLLADISEKELLQLEIGRSHILFSKGETIYKEGTRPTGILCLSKGKAKIIKNGPKQKELIISLKKPVDFIGFSELMADEPFTTSGIAIEESSICIIDREKFFSVMKSNSVFFMGVTRFLSTEIHHIANRMVSLVQKDMRARLADALLYIIDVYGLKSDNETVDVIVKRADIAAISNMTTSNVIRTLSDLKNEGVVDSFNKELKILKPDDLVSISKGQFQKVLAIK